MCAYVYIPTSRQSFACGNKPVIANACSIDVAEMASKAHISALVLLTPSGKILKNIVDTDEMLMQTCDGSMHWFSKDRRVF